MKYHAVSAAVIGSLSSVIIYEAVNNVRYRSPILIHLLS